MSQFQSVRSLPYVTFYPSPTIREYPHSAPRSVPPAKEFDGALSPSGIDGDVDTRDVESRRARNSLVLLLLASCPWIVVGLLVAHAVSAALAILAMSVFVLTALHLFWTSRADS
jgi:hypothetical protein